MLKKILLFSLMVYGFVRDQPREGSTGKLFSGLMFYSCVYHTIWPQLLSESCVDLPGQFVFILSE